MSAKKTNYIGYELEWLERKCKQLQDWVEQKLDGGIEDRIEVYESTRGNKIIKVISSEETQVKCLRDTLKELPNMLMEINRLRKLANEEEAATKTIRGDHKLPGFMDDDDDDAIDEAPSKKEKGSDKKTKSVKTLPPSSSKFDNSAYDDDFEDVSHDDEDYDDGYFEEP